MDDVMSFMIEMEERGLLTDPPSRVIPEKIPGHCRYCKKPVARGVWAHEKSCARKAVK